VNYWIAMILIYQYPHVNHRIFKYINSENLDVILAVDTKQYITKLYTQKKIANKLLAGWCALARLHVTNARRKVVKEK
jgi:ABC-type enterochelin transport system substrate-binding protein